MELRWVAGHALSGLVCEFCFRGSGLEMAGCGQLMNGQNVWVTVLARGSMCGPCAGPTRGRCVTQVKYSSHRIAHWSLTTFFLAVFWGLISMGIRKIAFFGLQQRSACEMDVTERICRSVECTAQHSNLTITHILCARNLEV